MRVRLAAPALLTLPFAVTALGCGGSPVPLGGRPGTAGGIDRPRTSDPAPTPNAKATVNPGHISIDCSPADAALRVNDSPFGPVSSIDPQGLALPAGIYRIELSRPGYRTFRIEIKLGSQPERIRVRLKPLEP